MKCAGNTILSCSPGSKRRLKEASGLRTEPCGWSPIQIWPAAGVWATAGVGMACGGRLYIVAAGATVVLIAVQCFFHLKPFRPRRYYSINIKFRHAENANEKIKEIFSVTRFNHLVINRGESGVTVYSATLNTDKEFSSDMLEKILEENEFILSVERCDDN